MDFNVRGEFIKVTAVDGVLPKHGVAMYTYTGRLRVKGHEGPCSNDRKTGPRRQTAPLSSLVFLQANTGGYQTGIRRNT